MKRKLRALTSLNCRRSCSWPSNTLTTRWPCSDCSVSFVTSPIECWMRRAVAAQRTTHGADDQRDDGADDADQQRQLRAHADHDDEQRQNRDRVAKRDHDRGRDRLGYLLRVVREPRDQHARRSLIEVARRQCQVVPEHLAAQSRESPIGRPRPSPYTIRKSMALRIGNSTAISQRNLPGACRHCARRPRSASIHSTQQ